LGYLANTKTDKLWQKHNLLGGGNNLHVTHALCCSQYSALTAKNHDIVL